MGLCTTGIEQRERTNQPYHDEELEGKQQRGEHKREETSSKNMLWSNHEPSSPGQGEKEESMIDFGGFSVLK